MSGLVLSRDTIFVTLAGSQAHGTAREGSDVDLRGVCVAPFAVRVSLFQPFEQHEGPLDGPLWETVHARLRAHPTASLGLSIKTESVVFDVAKLLRLCAAANPNALEILFADPADWVFETESWRRIYAQRRQFLSKKAQQTYVGYALAQLAKIRTHRSWLLSPPKERPTRAAMGLPEATTLSKEDQHRLEQAIADKQRSYGFDSLEMAKALRLAVEERMRAFLRDSLRASDETLEERQREIVVQALGLPPAVVAALAAERSYRAAVRHWESYEGWKRERNPARAALEAEHGYDTKHAMHLLRLLQTGLELLETGELVVRRADAAELSAVRAGALSYEELCKRTEELQARMGQAAAASALPADVDLSFVDELARSVIEERLPRG